MGMFFIVGSVDDQRDVELIADCDGGGCSLRLDGATIRAHFGEPTQFGSHGQTTKRAINETKERKRRKQQQIPTNQRRMHARTQNIAETKRPCPDSSRDR